MVCKEEVVFWFKELESYSRIDTLCALLNMCLPFELRFIGTCLEEMCIRDAKELRGLELHVNNSTELASEIAACQFGEPSDIKARRKMAMYLALIRACNRPCVNELFNTLYLWGQNDFLKTADGDALQELLLVYTMAAHHPVFSFEQRMKCGDIFIQIRFRNSERALLDEQTVQTRTSTPSNETSSSQHTQSQSHYQLSSPVEMMPNVQQPPPIANQLISSSAPIYEQGSHIGHRDVVNISPHPMFVENMQPVYHHQNVNFQASHACPNPSTSIGAAYAVTRQNMAHPRYPAHLSDHSESPSQPSSPIGSRSSSPKVNVQQQHHQLSNRHNAHKDSRSSSFDITSQQQQFNENELTASHGNKMSNENAMNDAASHTQSSYYNRNGYMRSRGPSRTIKTGGNHGHLAQMTLINQNNPNGLAYQMQNITLDGTPGANVVNVSGEDVPMLQKCDNDPISPGDSIENASPPETPNIGTGEGEIINATSTGNSSNNGSNTTNPNMGKNNKHRSGGEQHQHGGRLKMNSQHQNIVYGQIGPMQTVVSTNSNLPLSNEMMMSPQHSQQTQVTQQQVNFTGTGNNNNLMTSTVLISNKTPSPAAISGGFSISGNPPILFQQYPTQPPQHHLQQIQSNTTYHYTQHMPMNNRGAILATTNTTSAGPQPNATYRMLPYMQTNGEVSIYPHPSTLAYMQTTALSFPRPSSHQPTHTGMPTQTQPVVVSAQQQQPLPQQQTPLPATIMINPPPPSNLYQTTAIVTPDAQKIGVSCFNCGSHSHTGRDCQEASMEDVTRNTVYKLDYNSSRDRDLKSTDSGISADATDSSSSVSSTAMK